MAISIDLINILSNFLDKQTNNSGQGCNNQLTHCDAISLAHCILCGQVENKWGSRNIYFRVCYYIG